MVDSEPIIDGIGQDGTRVDGKKEIELELVEDKNGLMTEKEVEIDVKDDPDTEEAIEEPIPKEDTIGGAVGGFGNPNDPPFEGLTDIEIDKLNATATEGKDGPDESGIDVALEKKLGKEDDEKKPEEGAIDSEWKNAVGDPKEEDTPAEFLGEDVTTKELSTEEVKA